MPEKIVQGTIVDQETGESFEVNQCVYFTGAELTAIVKIIEIQSYDHEDQSMQVVVDCLGLDSIGSVFALTMDFFPTLPEVRTQILEDLKVDTLWMVKGRYCIIEDSSPYIGLYDPDYLPLPPEFSEEEVRKVFEINAPEMEKRG